MDKVQIFAGFLADERCIVLAQWTEEQVLDTFVQAKKHAERANETMHQSMRRAIGAYQSWGVREEERLRAFLLKSKPSIEKYVRYAVLRYARCLVERDTTETFEVRAIMPNCGAYLRDIHMAVGRSYDFENPTVVDDPVRRKLAINDCIRKVMDRYVHQVEGSEPLLQGLAQAEDVTPDDSISQVAASPPHNIAASRRSVATKASNDRVSESVRHKPTDSLFRQNVAQRLQEMNGDDDAPPNVDGPPDSVDEPPSFSTESRPLANHSAQRRPI